jgi:hypothetical protein
MRCYRQAGLALTSPCFAFAPPSSTPFAIVFLPLQSSVYSRAVFFLASDDSYINAIKLMADGGATGAPFGAPILRD